MEALEKTRLIANRTDINFSRCGRTDKGVSAFGNVRHFTILYAILSMICLTVFLFFYFLFSLILLFE